MVLGDTAWYCWVLTGTGRYWTSLGELVGTEGTGYSGVPEGSWENLWAPGLLGVTGGTWGYWGVIGGYGEVLLGTALYCWVPLGTTGYWGALGYRLQGTAG